MSEKPGVQEQIKKLRKDKEPAKPADQPKKKTLNPMSKWPFPITKVNKDA